MRTPRRRRPPRQRHGRPPSRRRNSCAHCDGRARVACARCASVRRLRGTAAGRDGCCCKQTGPGAQGGVGG
eukprot:scaffold21882_cov36-Phaeocystis_antarctica.AAC.1